MKNNNIDVEVEVEDNGNMKDYYEKKLKSFLLS